ncbi:lasso RiPP family leader peptide-containing protein [Nocardia alni]|uniref:lasso RiPP family leader peptide-containing protein n=1 Tax=Nocardia alni TaxID=2815723 RepID=UPI001C233BFF|nr:lasso RiPP family leader peptide-containing protein [Nocardia alni]
MGRLFGACTEYRLKGAVRLSDLEVTTVIEKMSFEPADVYEAPLLAEVGDFADLTQGNTGDKVEDGATWYQWS